MAWTARYGPITRHSQFPNTLVVPIVYDNGSGLSFTRQETTAQLSSIARIVKDTLGALAAVDAVVEAPPPVGADVDIREPVVSIPPPPSEAELAAQQWLREYQRLRTLDLAIAKGAIDSTRPLNPSLPVSVTNPLVSVVVATLMTNLQEGFRPAYLMRMPTV